MSSCFASKKQGVRQIVEKLQSQKFALWIASLGHQQTGTADIEKQVFSEKCKLASPIGTHQERHFHKQSYKTNAKFHMVFLRQYRQESGLDQKIPRVRRSARTKLQKG